MHRITHRNHITPDIPNELAAFIVRRFDQLIEESDGESIPIIILVEPDDDTTGPDYAFIGTKGLLSDLYDENEPGQEGFIRPWESVSHWPAPLDLYELLYLQDPDNGYLVLIDDSVVEKHDDLKWILTDPSQGGLSEPQPL